MVVKPYPSFNCPTMDGRNWVAENPLYCNLRNGRKLRAKKGFTTDGASTPRVSWNILPPFGGYWASAIFHDACYRDQIEEYVIDQWVSVTLDKSLCDSILLENMEDDHVSLLEREMIYNAVKDFGSEAFNGDRQEEVTTVSVTTTTTTTQDA